MATISDDIIIAVASQADCSPPSITVPEAASQTFVKGEIVFIDAGYVKEIASDTPSVIYGVAAEDAHNDASAGTHSVSVYLAAPHQYFAANVKTTSLADYVWTAADLGKMVQIQRDTTNSKVFLNVAPPNGGANVRAFIHALQNSTAGSTTGGVGDTNVRVLFTFVENFVQFLGTS